jgi:hypothetical protein
MNMRFEDVSNLHIIGLSNFEIGIHIPFCINNCGNACLLATDEITCLSKAFVVNVLKKHSYIFLIFKFNYYANMHPLFTPDGNIGYI